MRHKFGWDLPPGVTHRMIEEQAGAFADNTDMHGWEEPMTPKQALEWLTKRIRNDCLAHEGDEIAAYLQALLTAYTIKVTVGKDT